MNTKREVKYEFDFYRSLKEEPKTSILKVIRVERYLTRPLASLIVRALINTRVTPNQITVLAFVIGVGGGLCLGIGKTATFMVGGILTWLSSIVDCVDGMLARSRNTCSEYGAYLDLFLDRWTDFLMMCGLAVGYFRYSKDLLFFVVSLFGIMLMFLQISLYYLTRIFQKKSKFGERAEGRGGFIFLVFLFSLFNQIKPLIIFLLTVIAGYTVYSVVELIRMRIRGTGPFQSDHGNQPDSGQHESQKPPENHQGNAKFNGNSQQRK